MLIADRAALILCSHGTSSSSGRLAIRSIVDDVAAMLPEVAVHEAFVDVQQPSIDEVVRRMSPNHPTVIVPLLLSTGHHTTVDIARAVAMAKGASVATPALGPHPLITELLHDRLLEVGADADADAIVLAAAGSSDPRATDQVCMTAAALTELGRWRVTVGFAAGATPTVAEAVASARGEGARRVVVASHVLAPGHFAGVIRRAGGDLVTPPLAPDPRLARIVVVRYRTAAARIERNRAVIAAVH